MDNHHFMLKLSRLFPSSLTSCQFRTLPDVAEPSIPITKHNHHSSLPSKIFHKPPALAAPLTHTSTSNAASCFTSSDDVDTDTFFSLSSNSGDSFRLPPPTSRRFKLRDEMQSIDETARCSFSSAASFNTRPINETNGGGGGGDGRKPRRTGVVVKQEQGSDHISTQLYYNSSNGFRRRKGCGSLRRRIKKSSSGCGAVIGDSYAVEKKSRDPRGDFRASMVEMIVEKRIFAAEDLERLLRCFLSLNSTSYHGMIFEVFTQICETLFTN